jgi:hypothetical protein
MKRALKDPSAEMRTEKRATFGFALKGGPIHVLFVAV